MTAATIPKPDALTVATAELIELAEDRNDVEMVAALVKVLRLVNESVAGVGDATADSLETAAALRAALLMAEN